MKKCNEEFFRNNGINIEETYQAVDSRIYSREEINPIVTNYNFQGREEERIISVADIVGYDTEYRNIPKNIFQSMDYFFNENGSGYETRSLDMLEYNSDNVMEGLQKSFEAEPISLIETGEGSYTVANNGLHRFTILKILYLSEVAKAKGEPEELARLAEKYKIPANVTTVDLEKTYCKYLLLRAFQKDEYQDIADISSVLDDDYEYTGETRIEYFSGEQLTLDNAELIELTRQRVKESENIKDLQSQLQQVYNQHKSFRIFMDANFSDLIPLQKQELEERGQEQND